MTTEDEAAETDNKVGDNKDAFREDKKNPKKPDEPQGGVGGATAVEETPVSEGVAQQGAAASGAPTSEVEGEQGVAGGVRMDEQGMPRDGEGRVLYEQVPVAQTVKNIYEDNEMTGEEAIEFIQGQKAQAQSELSEWDKKKPSGGDFKDASLFKTAKAQWQQAREAAQAKADYWQAVEDSVKAAAETQTTEAQAKVQTQEAEAQTTEASEQTQAQTKKKQSEELDDRRAQVMKPFQDKIYDIIAERYPALLDFPVTDANRAQWEKARDAYKNDPEIQRLEQQMDEALARFDAEVGEALKNEEAQATEQTDVDEPKPIGKSSLFGNIYQWTKGKALEAVRFLKEKQSGYLKGVFYREGIGDIDMVWGNNEGGWMHIENKHIIKYDDFNSVEEAVAVIDEVINKGKSKDKGKDKIEITYGDYLVALEKTDAGTWVLTSYDYKRTEKEKRRSKTTDTTRFDQGIANRKNGTLVSSEVASAQDKGTTSSAQKQTAGETANADPVTAEATKEQEEPTKAQPKAAKKKPTKKTKPIDLYKFVLKDKDSQRNILKGVYYKDGYAYASDAHVLIKLKMKYPAKYEGKIIDKNGNVIEGRYPNAEAILQREYETSEHAPIAVSDMTERIKGALAFDKIIRQLRVKEPDSYGPPFGKVRLGDMFVDANLFKMFLDGAESIGVEQFSLPSSPVRAIIAQTENGVVLVMPVKGDDNGPDYDNYFDMATGLVHLSQKNRDDIIREFGTIKEIQQKLSDVASRLDKIQDKKHPEYKNLDKEQKDLQAALDLLQGESTPALRSQFVGDMFNEDGTPKSEQAQRGAVDSSPRATEKQARAIAAQLQRLGLGGKVSIVRGVKALYDAAKARLSVIEDGRNDLERAAKTIRGWLQNNARGKTFEIELPYRVQNMIHEAMGRDFDSHNITANGVAHAKKNHGLAGLKLTNTSIPLRDSDMELIPYIMVAPDMVEKGSSDVAGRESVRFIKKLSNGVVVVVEKEYKNSPQDMETITMWADMSSAATNARENHAPGTLVRNAIRSTDIAKIQQDAEKAKSEEKARLQAVYHGSGADFEAFDFSFMGTGEGAQAYGWGGYVTEVEGIGKAYAEKIGAKAASEDPRSGIEARRYNIRVLKRNIARNKKRLKEIYSSGNTYRAEFRKELRQRLKSDIKYYEEQIKSQEADLLELYKLPRKKYQHLYHVEIPNDNGSNYFDLEKTYDYNSSRSIASRVEKSLIGRYIDLSYRPNGYASWNDWKEQYVSGLPGSKMGFFGEDLYKALARILGSDKAASEFLAEQGYVGISYPVGYSSGGRKDGARNYVIFKESDMKITDHIRFEQDEQGEIAGATLPNGDVILNSEAMRLDTPFHEFAHKLFTYAQNNPQAANLYAAIRQYAENAPQAVKDYVKQHYPNLSGDAYLDEVFAWALSRQSEGGLEAFLKSRGIALNDSEARAWYEQVWNLIKQLWAEVRPVISNVLGKRYADLSVFDAYEAMSVEQTGKALFDLMMGGRALKPSVPGMVNEQSVLDRRGQNTAREAEAARKAEAEAIEREAKANGTWLKAPNGKDSHLSPKQWVQVRTKAFKAWFGDWEKSARIEKLRNSKPIEIKYNGEYLLTANDAQKWIKDNLRGEYKIDDTNETVLISNVGAEEVTSHNRFDEVHLKSISSIPTMLKNAIFITEDVNTKGNKKFDSYRYYALGLNIDGVSYTAKVVIGIKQGKKYYDHRLTQIEKTRLIDEINQSARDFTTEGNASLPPYVVGKDTTLISILQTNASKVVDENGEPLVVYHGTTNDETTSVWNENTKTYDTDHKPFTVFKRIVDGDRNVGFFFNNNVDNAGGYGYNVYETYLNLRNPLVIDANGRPYSDVTFNGETKNTDDWAKYAEQNGYDGVVFENIADGISLSEMQNNSTEYVAFRPSQIKSATDNVGSFSEANPDIRFQFVGSLFDDEGRPKDDVRFRRDGFEHNRGYTQRADGSRISKNASAAEDGGSFTAGKFCTEYGVSRSAFNALLGLGVIKWTAWHHTGANFKKSDFYEWADGADYEADYSKDRFPDGSMAAFYKDHKKEIDRLSKDADGKEFEYRHKQGLSHVPSKEAFVKAEIRFKWKDYLSDEERAAMEAEHRDISKQLLRSPRERYEMHTDVDERYQNMAVNRYMSEHDVDKEFAERWGMNIKANAERAQYNAMVDAYNEQTDGKEKVLLRIGELFGIEDLESKVAHLSEREQDKAEDERRVKAKKELALEKQKDEAALNDYLLEQVKNGKAVERTRIPRDKKPSMFVQTNEEMNGKFGWFHASSRYNLPVYVSGYEFTDEAAFNEFRRKQDEIIKKHDKAYSEIMSGVRFRRGISFDDIVPPANAPKNSLIGRSATKEEAEAILANMQALAEPTSKMELNRDNWEAQFGKDGMVNTPIGAVRLDYDQYDKMDQPDRNTKMGMIKHTLENPDIIVADRSEARPGKETERNFSYIFVKAFINEQGERSYFFTSVSNMIQGEEKVVSNQEKEWNRLRRIMENGRLAYINAATLPPESGSSIQGNQPALQTGELSNNKGTQNRVENQRYRFIGEVGAANLDKAEEATTRLDNLAVARDMEAAGVGVASMAEAAESATASTMAAKRETAERLSRQLGVPVVIEDAGSGSGRSGMYADVKGWYNVGTGTVHLNLGNHTDAADVERSILHEVVGHAGLRALTEKQNPGAFDALCDRVYASMSDEARAFYERYAAEGLPSGATKEAIARAAAEEYMAFMAEVGGETELAVS